jgi:uncharacterized membrane protein
MKPELLITLFHFVIVGVLFQFIPVITRPGIFFSATVEPDFPRSSEGRRILRSYRLQVGLWSLLGIGAAVVLLPQGLIRDHVRGFVAAQLLPLFGLLAAFIVTYWLKFREVHSKYGTRAPEVRQAELSAMPQRESFGLAIALPPFLAMAATGLCLYLVWDQLPNPYPVHYGLQGAPDRWANRDWFSVCGSLLIGAGLNLFLLGLAWLIARLSRNTVMRYVTVRLLQFMLYPLTLTMILVSLLPLWHSPVWLTPVVMLASIAALILWAYRKISSRGVQDATPEPLNDSYWKAGMFYYNPDDPAIFVAKRVGIGYTINFANKLAWIIMAGLLVLPLLPILLIHPR